MRLYYRVALLIGSNIVTILGLYRYFFGYSKGTPEIKLGLSGVSDIIHGNEKFRTLRC